MLTTYTLKVSPFRIAIADLIADPEMANTYWLSRINTPVGHRRKGWATILLTKVLQEADKHHVTLKLSILPSGDMTYVDLEKWYMKHGFVLEQQEIYVRYPHEAN